MQIKQQSKSMEKVFSENFTIALSPTEMAFPIWFLTAVEVLAKGVPLIFII